MRIKIYSVEMKLVQKLFGELEPVGIHRDINDYVDPHFNDRFNLNFISRPIQSDPDPATMELYITKLI